MLGLGSAGMAQTAKQNVAKPVAKQALNETKKQKKTRIVQTKNVDRSAKTATKTTVNPMAKEVFTKD